MQVVLKRLRLCIVPERAEDGVSVGCGVHMAPDRTVGMRSQNSEQRILNDVETQLRSDDPALAACFMAFTAVTRNTGMPPSEQWVEGRRIVCGRRRRRETRLSRSPQIQLIRLFFAGLTMFLTVPKTSRRSA